MKGPIKKYKSADELMRDERRYKRAITRTSDEEKKSEYAKKAAAARKERDRRRQKRMSESIEKDRYDKKRKKPAENQK